MYQFHIDLLQSQPPEVSNCEILEPTQMPNKSQTQYIYTAKYYFTMRYTTMQQTKLQRNGIFHSDHQFISGSNILICIPCLFTVHTCLLFTTKVFC